jgi:predicted DsbA family dithiol-disulfide isomerase
LHQLLNVANEEGIGIEMKERLLAAYFEETQHLNEPETLYAVAENFGWDREKVDAIINDQKIAETVKAEISYYQQHGVSAVPFFIINDTYGISGAQPSEVFIKALHSASPVTIISEGESCDQLTGEC